MPDTRQHTVLNLAQQLCQMKIPAAPGKYRNGLRINRALPSIDNHRQVKAPPGMAVKVAMKYMAEIRYSGS